MQRLFYQTFLLFLLSLSLTACGFHLRGHAPLPPQLRVLYLKSDNPNSTFIKQMKQVLRSIGVTLVDDAQSAPVTLQILNESTGQQLVSLGVSGQLATYLLSANVTYQLLDSHGQALQPPRTVGTSRNFSINANQVLGDMSVRSGLQEEMQRDLINQLFNQLRARGTVQLLSQH